MPTALAVEEENATWRRMITHNRLLEDARPAPPRPAPPRPAPPRAAPPRPAALARNVFFGTA